jgi:hypothetical protein
MNPEQIKQYLAMGYTPEMVAAHMKITVEQLNAMLAGPPAGLPPLPSAPPTAPAVSGGAAALAAKLAGADFGNSDSRKPPDGRHVVDLVRVSYNDELQNGACVIFEYTMVESTNPAAEIGGAYSKAYNVEDDKWGYGIADVKLWIGTWVKANVPGSNPEARWEPAFFTDAVGPANPMAGSRWSFTSRTETAKKSGNEFLKYTDVTLLAPGTKLGLGAAPAGGLPALPGLPGFPTTMPFPGGQ